MELKASGYYILIKSPHDDKICNHSKEGEKKCEHCRLGLPLRYGGEEGNYFYYLYAPRSLHSFTYCSGIKPQYVKEVSKEDIDKYLIAFMV